MATGFYTLGGVSVAAGSTTLTAATFAVPGSAPEAVNFANLVGIAGADGTPAGHLIIGPAGQVAVASHAASASQLTLAEPWPGAAVSNGECTLVLGINAMPIGRLAALMTQIALTRPMLASNRLSEFAGDPVAQAVVQANLGLLAAFLQKTGGSITGALSIGSSAAPGAELEVHALNGDSDVRIQLRANASHVAQLGCSGTQTFWDAGAGKAAVILTGGVNRFSISAAGVATFAQRPVFAGATPIDTGNIGQYSAIVDRAYAEFKTAPVLTAPIPVDNTIPQVTEGTQVLAATITPKSSTNRIHAQFVAWGTINAVDNLVAALFLNGAANALRAAYVSITAAPGTKMIMLDYEHVPGSTAAQTYSVRVGPGNGANTATLNGNTSSGAFFGSATGTSLTLWEIRA